MTTRRRFLSGLAGSGAFIFGYSSATRGGENRITDKDVSVIGHRGSSAKYNDNSEAGIRFAGQNEADGVELDIRRTADDILVLNHYPFRFGGIGSYSISDRTYEELKNSTGPVVKFSEAINIIREYDMELIIGMKEPSNAELIWETVLDMNYDHKSRMVMWTRHIEEYVLVPEHTIIVSAPPDMSLIDQAKEYDIETIMCHYADGAVSHFIEEANNNGLKAGYWSLVGSNMDLREGLSKDPDIIMTNRPKEAVEILSVY